LAIADDILMHLMAYCVQWSGAVTQCMFLRALRSNRTADWGTWILL